MSITTLALTPSFPSLKLETGSYASSETRLDFSLSFGGSGQIVDQNGDSLTDLPWSLRLYETGSSVRAENDRQGAGSVRCRPPSPNMPDLPGDCLVQADMSTTAFSSLVAVCVAGILPACIYLEIDGLEDDEEGRLCWDRSVHSTLVVTSLSMSTGLTLER